MVRRGARAGGIDGSFDTSDHETLITRPRDPQNNATPSGNEMAVTALLKLAGLSNETRHVDLAHEVLTQIQPMMAQYPLGFGPWLQALEYALSQPREIAIVSEPDSADTQALLCVVRDGYPPFRVVALGAPKVPPPAVRLLQAQGLVEGKPRPTCATRQSQGALSPVRRRIRNWRDCRHS